MYFTSNDGFQNMFVYQPSLDMRKYKSPSNEYVISWKWTGVYNSKIIALNSDFQYFFYVKYFVQKYRITVL